MSRRNITIATRESQLALWQTTYVRERLEAAHPGIAVTILGMTTEGDQTLDQSLAKIGGKGLFVKELEKALIDGRADIAVHSVKDLPMEFPANLGLAAVLERESPNDVLAGHGFTDLSDLPLNARVGTSSLRRQAQLLALRPDLSISFVRGNVNTRLRKLDGGEYDAIVLAEAGLKRLNLAERIRYRLMAEECLPAAGQGVVGVECRLDDEEVIRLLQPLNDEYAMYSVSAERAVTHRLNGSCSVPIAAFAEISDQQLRLRALVAEPDGTIVLRTEQQGVMVNAADIGREAAEDLLSQGAADILERCQ